MEEAEDQAHQFGTITVLTVDMPYRRMKVGTRLLQAVENALIEVYGVRYALAQVTGSQNVIAQMLVNNGYQLFEDAPTNTVILKHMFTDETLLDRNDTAPALKEWRKRILREMK